MPPPCLQFIHSSPHRPTFRSAVRCALHPHLRRVPVQLWLCAVPPSHHVLHQPMRYSTAAVSTTVRERFKCWVYAIKCRRHALVCCARTDCDLQIDTQIALLTPRSKHGLRPASLARSVALYVACSAQPSACLRPSSLQTPEPRQQTRRPSIILSRQMTRRVLHEVWCTR